MANKIIIGPVEAPILVFDDPEITALGEESAVSLTGAELAADIMFSSLQYEVFVDYKLLSADGYTLISADGYELRPYSNYDLKKLPYATKLTYYIDNQIRGEFYCQFVKRTGQTVYQINTISAVGLMTKQRSPGGIYTGQTLGAVLQELLGDTYQYSVTDDAARVQVYGWLPYSTRRDNLHRLITAYGINILRADTGGMLFAILANSTATQIPDGEIYIDGSVDYGEAASRVEVTEHAYFYLESAAEEVLFDNTRSDMVVNTLITFDKPFYADSLYCSEGSLEILERHVNYVRVTGTGILMGKPYTHTTRVVAAENDKATTERVVQMKDDTLVTVANADNVLLRLAEYYFNATVIKSDIVLKNEKCGRIYRLNNAFHEQSTGFLSKISASASGVTKASCEFIENYTPTGQGNTYTSLDRLTDSSGVWTIPDSVFEKPVPYIRVVIIGPGQRGGRGADGEAGTRATETSGGKGGLGGLGGLGGDGGNVLSLTIDCTGLKSFSYAIGSSVSFRGNGIWLNSDNGASSSTGFLDVFTGTVYALPGQPGQDGAPGGDGGIYKHTNSRKYPTEAGSITYNGKEWTGGKPGAQGVIKIGSTGNLDGYCGGGGPGGAAVGSNGADGKGYPAYQQYGGAGANASSADPARSGYGHGGHGGHGGGGGGGAGQLESWNHVYNELIGYDPGSPGPGGKASDGSDGAPGCILIYF